MSQLAHMALMALSLGGGILLGTLVHNWLDK